MLCIGLILFMCYLVLWPYELHYSSTNIVIPFVLKCMLSACVLQLMHFISLFLTLIAKCMRLPRVDTYLLTYLRSAAVFFKLMFCVIMKVCYFIM